VKRFMWIGLALSSVLLLGACGSSSSTKAGGAQVTGTPLTLTMTDFSFSPTTIQAKAGATLAVRLVNKGAAEHNFTVKALKIDKDVEAGETATVQVKVPASSTPFYCEYHQARGMTGNLTVTQ
jgi:plastocyanin